MSTSNNILTFWFGNATADLNDLPQQQQLWWGKSDDMDAMIKRQFGDDVIKASEGKYAHWERSAKERLALIILLDQFSRNIYRHTPQAFANDAQVSTVAAMSAAKSRNKVCEDPRFRRSATVLSRLHGLSGSLPREIN